MRSGLFVVIMLAGCSKLLGLSAPHEQSDSSVGDDDAGPPGGSFTFAIQPQSVNVPQGGMNFVDITITRTGGYAEAVTVSVDAPPAGLQSTPAMLAAGDTTGHVVVSATGQLALGTSFMLMLDATGGSGTAEIDRTAMVPAVVTGASGSLDTSFGSAGDGIIDISSARGAEGDTVDFQSDGKLLAGGGTFGLAGPFGIVDRFDGSGDFDTTWNGNGTQRPNVLPPNGSGLEDNEPFALGHQLGGDLIVGGEAHQDDGPLGDDILLVALKPDGTLDTKFGFEGQGTNELGFIEMDLGANTEDVLDALVIDSNDRPTFGGSRDGSAYVGRADAQGFGLDTGFAGTGVFVPAVAAGAVTALALANGGKVVAVGSTTVNGHGAILVMRLTSAGALDPAFHGGAVETLGGATFDESGAAVFVLADQSIVVIGTTTENGGADVVMHRLAPDGTPDATLGGDGHVVAVVTNGDDNVKTARQLSDGRIVVGINAGGGDTPGPVLARLGVDGTLDPTFGTGGVASIFFGTGDSLADLAVDPAEQKIVVTGLETGTEFADMVLARFWN